jgi:hypothetical protein
MTKVGAALLGNSLLLLAGLTACAHQTLWNDATGQNRGQSGFIMADGQCRMTAQNAGNQQQALNNQQNAVTPCYGNKGCAATGFGQGLAVGAAINGTYANCMHSLGWIEQPR